MQAPSDWILLPENRAARQAIERVVQCVWSGSSRRTINPLFLHGPTGTGKTHLVNDLIRQLTRDADRQVALLQASDIPIGLAANTSEEDREEMTAARHADVILIEDLQHLPARAVDSLVQVLDRCLSRQQQVVCTANRGPAQISHLPARLANRLAQGLVVGLEALSPPSRRHYLALRASGKSKDVLDWLAEHTPGSIRQLEGSLRRLDQLELALGRSALLEEVHVAFREDADAATPTVERIAQQVGRYFRVAPQQLCSDRRSRQVLVPRQVGMYLARQLTSLSLQQIGAYFGGRDHSTVLHACRKVEQALTSDASLCGAVRDLRADLA
jgi:chromosomal replication initiator protein